MTETRLSGLTVAQTQAIAELGIPTVELGRSTATLPGGPAEAVRAVAAGINGWQGARRGHPVQSAQSVYRKLLGGEGKHVKVLG
jgi:hypothetical protein